MPLPLDAIKPGFAGEGLAHARVVCTAAPRMMQAPAFIRRLTADSAPIRFSILVVVAVMSLRLALLLVASQLFHGNLFFVPEFGLVRHLDETVPRPFAYRVLADVLVRFTIAINISHISLPYLDRIARVAWQSQHVSPAATYVQIKAYAAVATAFAWGFLFTTYLVSLRAFRSVPWAAVTTILGAFVVNSLLLAGAAQPYDFLALFFSTILFLAAIQQNDVVFALLLPLAFLSKESLFLFVPVYTLIAYGHKPTRRIIINLVIQAAIFIAVYGWERAQFAHNAGAPMYHDLSGHVRQIFTAGDLYAVLATALTGDLLLYRFPFKPVALRRSMLILPVLLLLYFVGGSPGEFRIIFDVFPIVLLPISDSLLRLVTGRDPPDFLSRFQNNNESRSNATP